MSTHFDTCALVVGDSIDRLTLQITHNLDPAAALPAALAAGRQFMAQHRASVARYRAGRCRFKFRPLSEVQQAAAFLSSHTQLQALYRDDARFRQSVQAFAQVYLSRGDKVMAAEDRVQQAQLAATYLLEEAALFACLVQEGVTVCCDPGSIEMFDEIVQRQHRGVPDPLKQMILVSLRLKRGGAHIGKLRRLGVRLD